MIPKAKSVTKAWALKHKHADIFKGTLFRKTTRIYETRKEARNYRSPGQSVVRVRVTVEEL